jgi:hypothetical protein
MTTEIKIAELADQLGPLLFQAISQQITGLVGDHGALTGLLDDDHPQYASSEGSGTRRAYEAGRLNKNVSAGTGLSGGGTLTSSVTLNIDYSGGNPNVIQPDDGVLAGSSDYPARADHEHGIFTGAPSVNLSATSSNAEGSSTSFARADHSHAVTWSAAPSLGSSHLLGVGTNGELDLLGDFSVDADTLYVDVSEDAVYINAGTLPTRRGALTVHPATTSQQGFVLEQLSGQIADLLRVYDSSGNDLILLNSIGDLESGNPNFVSGLTGWQITHDGNAEFNNLVARGELHASIFVADEMHATGGTLILATASPLVDQVIMPLAGNSVVLNIQASYSTGLSYFAVDDVLRLKSMGQFTGSIDLYDIYLEVDSVGSQTGRDMSNGEPGYYPTTCTVRVNSDNGVKIPSGTTVVKWGHISTTTGGIILTSDLSLSPYIDIFTNEGATPWTNTLLKPRVRVGNLDGVLSLTEQWGIAMGTDLSDDTLPHIIASDQQFSLKGVHQYWWDSGSNLIGEVDPDATGTDPWFWLGPSASDKKFEMRADGNLIVRGNVMIGPNVGFTVTPQLYWPFDGTGRINTDFQVDISDVTGLDNNVGTGYTIGVRGKFGKCAQHLEGGRINSIYNPVFDSGTSNWLISTNGTGGSLTRDTSRQYIGGASWASLKVTAATGATLTLAYNSPDASCPNGYFVHAQCRVYRASGTYGAGLQIRDATNGITRVTTSSTKVGEWELLYAIWQNTTGSTVNVRIHLTNTATDGATADWFDAAQMEVTTGLAPSPFFYGDMPNCSWTGTVGASTTQVDQSSYLKFDRSIEPKESVSFWFSPMALPDQPSGSDRLFEWGDGTSDHRLTVLYNQATDDLRVYAVVGGSGVGIVLATVSDLVRGEWYHIAFTVDPGVSGGLRAYFNGEFVQSMTPPAWTTKPSKIFVSYGAQGSIFKGQIDDLLIVDGILSDDEVAQIYGSGAPINAITQNFSLFMTDYSYGKVYGSAKGLFGMDNAGKTNFAIINGGVTSWGGFTGLAGGDVVLGSNTSGSVALWWDNSSGSLSFWSNGYTTNADMTFSSGGDITARRWGIVGNYQTSSTSTFIYLGGTPGTSLAKGVAMGGTTLGTADFNLYTSNSPSDSMYGTLLLRKSGTSAGYGTYLTIEAEEAYTDSGIIYLFGNVLVASASGSLPTGGAKGRGTINAKAVYDDNVLLGPDYVFDSEYKAKILPIPAMKAFYQKNKHLPTIPSRQEIHDQGNIPIGELSVKLWETIEIQAIYITELQDRIEVLEKEMSRDDDNDD